MSLYLKSPLSEAELTTDGVLAINIITYTNAEAQKKPILAENRNKSWLYR